MLYANCYRKPADGSAGFSTQEYLGSFSVNATEIPPAFDAMLRRATVGRPQRYLELYERLRVRVLEPARERQKALELLQQRQHILGMLGFARQQLEGVGAFTDIGGHLPDREVQDAVASAVACGQRLLLGQPVVDTGNLSGDEPESAGDRHDAPELRLRELLTTINGACAEIADMMPEAAKQFRRGHPFEHETIDLVQQMWFRTSDAVAALNGRGPLKRPKVWDRLRAGVMPKER